MSLNFIEKLVAMLHYFIHKGGSIPTLGKTVLYKLCYFSDFDFYEIYERSITGSKYRKIDNGPAPFLFDAAMRKLEEAGLVEVGQMMSGSYLQFKYTSLKTPTQASSPGKKRI